MNINVTEQTTTFPYPVKKLKGNLMDNIGYGMGSQNMAYFVLEFRFNKMDNAER